jgi:hypothetical protein
MPHQSLTDKSLSRSITFGERVQPISGDRGKRPRRISPQSGKALEKLGHAIEYLADEVAHHGGSLSGADPRIQAIQMLMALNRRIYFECPIVPTVGERVEAFFVRQRERLFERLVKMRA